MRKFNVDELIWFIIQVILIFLMYFLISTGNITNFINDEMIIYFYIAIVILTLFTIAQVSKIFTVRGRKDITNKFLPITLVLVVSIVFLFVLPSLRTLKLNSINDKLSFLGQDTIVITNENYTILKELENNKIEYDNRYIQLVAKVYDNETEDGTVALVREEISCCQSDKTQLIIKTKGIKEKIDKGTWVNIIGKVQYNNGWYIDVVEYKMTVEPQDVFFHQKL